MVCDWHEILLRCGWFDVCLSADMDEVECVIVLAYSGLSCGCRTIADGEDRGCEEMARSVMDEVRNEARDAILAQMCAKMWCWQWCGGGIRVWQHADWRDCGHTPYV